MDYIGILPRELRDELSLFRFSEKLFATRLEHYHDLVICIYYEDPKIDGFLFCNLRLPIP